MRVDAAAPRTWLLAAVAAWAVLTCLLALAGMGAHIAPLPPDPALRQTLPTPHPSPPDRLGPLAQYAEVGTRPLFSEDRRPKPFRITPEGGDQGTPADAFDYVLSSVLITPQVRLAIVQPTAGGKSVSFHLGESADDLPNWRLVALNPRNAVFEGPGGQKSLDLRVWPGGNRPTAPAPGAPNAVSDADAAAPALPAPPPPATPAATPASPASSGGRLGEEPAPEDKDEDARAKQQMDAIRKRIEERRAQLRREAQGQPPGSTPPE